MKNLFATLMIFVLVFQPLTLGAQAAGLQWTELQDDISMDAPGYPLPQRPVPYHEPGHLSNAMQYTTQVQTTNPKGQLEITQLRGLDAMAANGIDPLAGNYTLVSLDKIARYSVDSAGGGRLVADTFSLSGSLQKVTDTVPIGGYSAFDVAAGDLNGDYLDEQIGLYLGDGDAVTLRIG